MSGQSGDCKCPAVFHTFLKRHTNHHKQIQIHPWVPKRGPVAERRSKGGEVQHRKERYKNTIRSVVSKNGCECMWKRNLLGAGAGAAPSRADHSGRVRLLETLGRSPSRAPRTPSVHCLFHLCAAASAPAATGRAATARRLGPLALRRRQHSPCRPAARTAGAPAARPAARCPAAAFLLGGPLLGG